MTRLIFYRTCSRCLRPCRRALRHDPSRREIRFAAPSLAQRRRGTERVLHSFVAASTDGCGPAAGLISLGGRFYGTTAYGGAYGHLGTVFSIGTTGAGERVLHSFGSRSDGKYPEAALRELNGMLYGTTENGGTANHGTVFVLRP
jgi:uncharacterized repeat protein (TIGR03803 family)